MKHPISLLILLLTSSFWCNAQDLDPKKVEQSLALVKKNASTLSNDPIAQIFNIELSFEQNYASMPKTNIEGHGFLVFGIDNVDSYSFLQSQLNKTDFPVIWDASINDLEAINRSSTDLEALLWDKDQPDVISYNKRGKVRKQVLLKAMSEADQLIVCTNIIYAAEQLDEMGESTIGLFVNEAGKISQRSTLNVAILSKEHALQQELSSINTAEAPLLINAIELRHYSYNPSFRQGLSPVLRTYINLFDVLILL